MLKRASLTEFGCVGVQTTTTGQMIQFLRNFRAASTHRGFPITGSVRRVRRVLILKIVLAVGFKVGAGKTMVGALGSWAPPFFSKTQEARLCEFNDERMALRLTKSCFRHMRFSTPHRAHLRTTARFFKARFRVCRPIRRRKSVFLQAQHRELVRCS